MNLRGVIDIPAWVETSTNLGTLKSNIDLKVEGGTGSLGQGGVRTCSRK
jgi:hypothetical protein